MNISPDAIVYWEWGFVQLNATIVFTWAVMALLALTSWLVTRRLKIEGDFSRWQMFLESLVDLIRRQIRDITRRDPAPYLPFIGTLFLFISLANFLAFIPGYEPPTGSLTTTAALAICVFFAVPIYGIAQAGAAAYFKHYIQPSPFMLPFHVIGELSRTLALAVRLFGNVMSGTMIAALLLSVAPLFLPVIMEALSLLIGQIQAYIFAVLATVYIASATRAQEQEKQKAEQRSAGKHGDDNAKDNDRKHGDDDAKDSDGKRRDGGDGNSAQQHGNDEQENGNRKDSGAEGRARKDASNSKEDTHGKH